MSQAVVNHLDSVTPSVVDPRIVPADPGNATRLAEIACTAFAADKERYGSGPPGLDDPATHRSLIEQGHCHEIWDEGKLAGAAYVFYTGSGEWGLGSIFVDPSRQQRGLGSKLMWFIARAHPHIKRVRLDTPYANTHLHRFYESNAYRVVGTTEPGSHPEAIDPDFHLIKYQRDRWEPPWVASDAEILEAATALQNDFRSGNVHGIETHNEGAFGSASRRRRAACGTLQFPWKLPTDRHSRYPPPGKTRAVEMRARFCRTGH